ncbi:MAG: hypothetical protein GX346_07065 [Clostridiales bacterium]|nr:hypothetical protein [Clostridiales bacterium]
MIIHSIISLEDIFAEEYQPKTQTIRKNNSFISLDISGDKPRIKSIFSTDPKDYLNKKYQPNSIYDFKE